MPRILTFTTGPSDWQRLLADPMKHWRSGYSARTLAHCWEAEDGFPAEVSMAFSQTTDPLLIDLVPLLAVPEFKVPLPGGSRASQTDIFVLARSSAGPVCIMVEGKVNESFGPTLDEWQADASPGKDKRFRFLLRTLCSAAVPDGGIRYQFLHRAASAIIAAEQYRAVAGRTSWVVHTWPTSNCGCLFSTTFRLTSFRSLKYLPFSIRSASPYLKER